MEGSLRLGLVTRASPACFKVRCLVHFVHLEAVAEHSIVARIWRRSAVEKARAGSATVARERACGRTKEITPARRRRGNRGYRRWDGRRRISTPRRGSARFQSLPADYRPP